MDLKAYIGNDLTCPRTKSSQAVVGGAEASKVADLNKLVILSKATTVGSSKAVGASKIAPSGTLLDSEEEEQTTSDCIFNEF
ncbi:hypothetical protein VNO80_23103 [Phaseolus coccineus]|uniref:Uncharacterized protein n=1 Tax=Phaseolus coccineus TaxID=3886 RepID=A0AAN9QSC0_PHACN